MNDQKLKTIYEKFISEGNSIIGMPILNALKDLWIKGFTKDEQETFLNSLFESCKTEKEQIEKLLFYSGNIDMYELATEIYHSDEVYCFAGLIESLYPYEKKIKIWLEENGVNLVEQQELKKIGFPVDICALHPYTLKITDEQAKSIIKAIKTYVLENKKDVIKHFITVISRFTLSDINYVSRIEAIITIREYEKYLYSLIENINTEDQKITFLIQYAFNKSQRDFYNADDQISDDVLTATTLLAFSDRDYLVYEYEILENVSDIEETTKTMNMYDCVNSNTFGNNNIRQDNYLSTLKKEGYFSHLTCSNCGKQMDLYKAKEMFESSPVSCGCYYDNALYKYQEEKADKWITLCSDCAINILPDYIEEEM